MNGGAHADLREDLRALAQARRIRAPDLHDMVFVTVLIGTLQPCRVLHMRRDVDFAVAARHRNRRRQVYPSAAVDSILQMVQGEAVGGGSVNQLGCIGRHQLRQRVRVLRTAVHMRHAVLVLHAVAVRIAVRMRHAMLVLHAMPVGVRVRMRRRMGVGVRRAKMRVLMADAMRMRQLRMAVRDCRRMGMGESRHAVVAGHTAGCAPVAAPEVPVLVSMPSRVLPVAVPGPPPLTVAPGATTPYHLRILISLTVKFAPKVSGAKEGPSGVSALPVTVKSERKVCGALESPGIRRCIWVAFRVGVGDILDDQKHRIHTETKEYLTDGDDFRRQPEGEFRHVVGLVVAYNLLEAHPVGVGVNLRVRRKDFALLHLGDDVVGLGESATGCVWQRSRYSSWRRLRPRSCACPGMTRYLEILFSPSCHSTRSIIPNCT